MADLMTQNRLAMRPDWRSYMQLPLDPPDADKPNGVRYVEIGEGFTSVSETKNPQEYSVRYVHETTERTSVTGYSPSISYTCDLYSLDPCCRRVAEAHTMEQIGTDAVVPIVQVDYWHEVEKGLYFAYLRKYSIIPDTKGDGTDALNYSGNFRAMSDMVFGLWDVAKGEFEEAEIETPVIEEPIGG